MNKQVHVFSVDTSAFYNEEEIKIHRRQNRNYRFRTTLKEIKNKKSNDELLLNKVNRYIKYTNRRIKKSKELLYTLFRSNKTIRSLRPTEVDSKKLKNIVSVFDSTLTRVLQIKENSLFRDIIIVQTYFFDVLEDIIVNGFLYNNEKYVCFTASAGQIRTKKTVFIKESVFQKHQRTLMCGLTTEKINELGGVNINKYLAYLALCNSATEQWHDFDIEKTIVVDDMCTTVKSMVDFIDDKTYKIERKEMDIPIEHTDGCGMILPRKSKKAMMIRLPWVKGLLVPFPFDKFLREKNKQEGYNKYGIIKDIYGKEHDVLKEEIEIIFTKSQFKMWKYYSSWSEYMSKYLDYNCQAGKCNEEEDTIGNAKLNYQMLQTLTDITDEELKQLSHETIQDIQKIGSDRDTMLKVLGVTSYNQNKNSFQKALEFYPELLSDTYSREVIKQVKKSLVKNAKAGKLNIEGKYTFISPDLYAFCEYLFLGKKNPQGLLQNKEVYCDLFDNELELDCLRSPHLYREHAVRRNKKDKEMKRWFVSKSIYTSVHDPISKILMFDNDGDKALVCSDLTLIAVAKRNMKNIYPLYYEMAKAQAELINSESIYLGLNAAYTGGNIGIISNDITKIWNSNNIDLDVIKILCMENNFTIDYAKTLYKPLRPTHIKEKILTHTKTKAPHFFIYAKDKSENRVEISNDSAMNRLSDLIPNPRISFKKAGLGKFDYRLLMKNSEVIVNDNKCLIELYAKLDLEKKFKVPYDEKIDDSYLYKDIRNVLLESSGMDLYEIVDILVAYLYNHKKSNHKITLWSSFGDIIVKNLLRNLGKIKICENCGKEYIVSKQRQIYCDDCFHLKTKEREKEKKRKQRKKLSL
ncbi:hypothetical protein [Paenibacillus polymyxa]|uniref:hypothetical protein n=1 Tax=Paenibacillus polymyxa TaxID=1406 RepID=UPI00041D1E94|nr:hypothetical protein [Paenibacillus polymyxa]